MIYIHVQLRKTIFNYVSFIRYEPESLNHHKIKTNTIQINVVLDILISLSLFCNYTYITKITTGLCTLLTLFKKKTPWSESASEITDRAKHYQNIYYFFHGCK
jgi:hypothetical protein